MTPFYNKWLYCFVIDFQGLINHAPNISSLQTLYTVLFKFWMYKLKETQDPLSMLLNFCSIFFEILIMVIITTLKCWDIQICLWHGIYNRKYVFLIDQHTHYSCSVLDFLQFCCLWVSWIIYFWLLKPDDMCYNASLSHSLRGR